MTVILLNKTEAAGVSRRTNGKRLPGNNFKITLDAYLGLYVKIPIAVSTSLPLMASKTKHAFCTDTLA